MLTYQDCVGMCSLDDDEICAVAEHEHLPQIIALEYAEYVIHTQGGERMLRRIIIDDIRDAAAAGDEARAARLRAVMRHFITNHPHHAPARLNHKPDNRAAASSAS